MVVVHGAAGTLLLERSTRPEGCVEADCCYWSASKAIGDWRQTHPTRLTQS